MVIATLFLILFIFLFLIWRRNNLSLLEILTIFGFVSTINLNLSDIFIANMKLLKIDKQQIAFWRLFIYQSFVIPVFIVLFIDLLSKRKALISKVSLFIFWVALLTFLEYVASWIGIFTFLKWHISWSLIEWTCIVTLAIWCSRFLHYLLEKGVR
ncbi:CBO0543 family protein [Fredinandcohnia humi]